MPSSKNAFIALIRLGLGQSSSVDTGFNWHDVESLAIQQGVLSIVVDGIERLPESFRPSKNLLLLWIGLVMQDETRYAIQQEAAKKMALLFHDNCIRTYVLKGLVVAECYPKPEHRICTDLDCFLLPDKGEFDAWKLGNEIIKASGYKVETGFYKNSGFYLPDLTVENHKFFTPFRGNKRLKNCEKLLQKMIKDDNGQNRIYNNWLYRPPVMVTALFLIEHAYSHFLHEGLTLRHLLDWVLFRRMHIDDIDWSAFDSLLDEFGFKKFYLSYYNVGQFIIGELDESNLSEIDLKLYSNIWEDLDIPETYHGIKAKLAMVGSTMRARWKYHYFSEISMPQALWIQVKGFLFEKHPTLD